MAKNQSNSPVNRLTCSQPHVSCSHLLEPAARCPMRGLICRSCRSHSPLCLCSARCKHTLLCAWWLHMLCPTQAGRGHGSVLRPMHANPPSCPILQKKNSPAILTGPCPVCVPVTAWLAQGPLPSPQRDTSITEDTSVLSMRPCALGAKVPRLCCGSAAPALSLGAALA